MQQVVRPCKHFEEFLDWTKEHEDEVLQSDLMTKSHHIAQLSPKVDVEWYDEQLYLFLSLVTTGNALQPAKNRRGVHGARGSASW